MARAEHELTETEREAGFSIEALGGSCPVQGEGTLDGRIWYFRARGERWTFEVWAPGVTWKSELLHGLPDEAPVWGFGGNFGTPDSFEAGYMPVEEAERLIRESAQKFLLYLAAGKIL